VTIALAGPAFALDAGLPLLATARKEYSALGG